jgi:hypothetical protein
LGSGRAIAKVDARNAAGWSGDSLENTGKKLFIKTNEPTDVSVGEVTASEVNL